MPTVTLDESVVMPSGLSISAEKFNPRKLVEDILDKHEICRKVLQMEAFSREAAQFQLALSEGRYDDALDILDEILSQYIGQETKKAEEMVERAKEMGQAIAEIRKLWAKVKANLLRRLSEEQSDEPTIYFGWEEGEELTRIDVLMKRVLGDSQGVNQFKENWHSMEEMKKHRVSRDEVEGISASVDGYCQMEQIEVDTENQHFKDLMIQVQAAQQEIRDTRQAIVSFARR